MSEQGPHDRSHRLLRRPRRLEDPLWRRSLLLRPVGLVQLQGGVGTGRCLGAGRSGPSRRFWRRLFSFAGIGAAARPIRVGDDLRLNKRVWQLLSRLSLAGWSLRPIRPLQIAGSGTRCRWHDPPCSLRVIVGFRVFWGERSPERPRIRRRSPGLLCTLSGARVPPACGRGLSRRRPRSFVARCCTVEGGAYPEGGSSDRSSPSVAGSWPGKREGRHGTGRAGEGGTGRFI